GGEARDALVGLFAQRADSTESTSVRALRDIRTVFAKEDDPNAMHASTLVQELRLLEESGWDTYYEKGLNTRRLTTLLKPYEIESTTVRAGVLNEPGRGYRFDDFVDAWNRYASPRVTDVTEPEEKKGEDRESGGPSS